MFVVRNKFIFLQSIFEQVNYNSMYAIVNIAGQQLKVEKKQTLFVNRIEAKEGSKIDFDKILLIDNDGKVEVGTPVVKNMIVSAKIVSHLKGDKVKVFKKKRRKGYRVLKGHRQALTEIEILDIAKGTAKTLEAKPEKKESTPKASVTAAKKTTAKKEETVTPDKPKASTAKKEETKTTEKKATPKAKAEPKTATKPKAKPAAATTKKESDAKKAVPKAPAKKTATAKKTDQKSDKKSE